MAIATIILAIFSAFGSDQFAHPQAVCDGASADEVDPVENAPFSAQRRVITITRNADGTSSRAEATESEARDGKGRTYRAGERFWTTLVENKRVQKSEILVRISDPVASISTTWSSGSNVVKVVHGPRLTGQTKTVDRAFSPFADALGSEVQKLGTKTIKGLLAEGARMSYTVPPAQAKCDNHNAVVSECWYSPELKAVILETRNDPCSGSFTNQLETIIRGEPDVAKYQPPAEYIRQNVEMPQPPR